MTNNWLIAGNHRFPATPSSDLPTPERRLRLHVWVQSYWTSSGGIQTFSQFVVRALRDLYPEAEICVFSKNDRRSKIEGTDREVAAGSTRVACAPRAVLGEWGERGVPLSENR
jgi:hypothetical protein